MHGSNLEPCAAVDLFRKGRLPRRGFITQEQVELPVFLANRFGAADQQSRQVESIGQRARKLEVLGPQARWR